MNSTKCKVQSGRQDATRRLLGTSPRVLVFHFSLYTSHSALLAAVLAQPLAVPSGRSCAAPPASWAAHGGAIADRAAHVSGPPSPSTFQI